MTRTITIIKLFLLPLTLGIAACDKEDTDNAEPNDEAVSDKADGEGHRGPRGLARLDVDNDGFISQAEAKDHRIADKFAELDADKDGKLSRDELQAMKGRHGGGRGGKHGDGHGDRFGDKDPAERAAHMLARFDTNKDGAIGQDELADHPRLASHFAEVDTDKDGKLTSAELQAMKGRGDKHGGRGDKFADKDPAERAAHMLSKFDADKDGSLSAAELADHPKFAGKFAEVDTDKDGKLSTAELTAFKAKHQGERGDRGGDRDRGPRGDQRGEAQL
jgi:Ca2+-binding EF-hand superfamily protein